MERLRNNHEWVDRLVTMTVLLSVSFIVMATFFLIILVTQPAQIWLRDLRILGLSFNVAGALTSLIPRALRDRKDIDSLAGTYYGENPHFKAFLLRDTRIAQWGMIVFSIGFALQLIGNLG